MKRIKVQFCDYERFMLDNNVILDELRKIYDVEVSDSPDILFYSVFGKKHYGYKNCIKVFVSAEPIIPNFNEADYAISCCDLIFEDRHCYYPYYFILNIEKLMLNRNDEVLMGGDRKFCNFIYSHTASTGGRLRNEFCRQLMTYKKVDCLGKVMHNEEDPMLGSRNDGNWNLSKIKVLAKYKFTIAFENTCLYGYTTEKLIDPLVAHSVPLYYGNPKIKEYINPNCFIDATKYIEEGRLDELLQYIEEIDNNDELYDSFLCEPILNKKAIEKIKINFIGYLCNIVERGTRFEKDPYDFENKNRVPSIQLSKYLYYNILYFINSHPRVRKSFLKIKSMYCKVKKSR